MMKVQFALVLIYDFCKQGKNWNTNLYGTLYIAFLDRIIFIIFSLFYLFGFWVQGTENRIIILKAIIFNSVLILKKKHSY